jgi:Trk K+ transport system NAD-binding subunit
VPEDEPIVVVGLGNVGLRLLEDLRHAGVPAVAVERDPDCPFVPAAAAHVPVIIGDGRLPEILERAGAASAHAVVAVTGDDAANLGIALAAREMNPRSRTVARLFDADFAAKVEGTLGLSAALSASRTAAPAFAAAALHPDALTAFSSEDRFFVVAPERVSLELAGRRPSELRSTGPRRVILRRPAAGGGHELSPDDRPLLPGEEVVVLVERRLE